MLLGRAAERTRIDRLLAGARTGHSGVLVVLGEAGLGSLQVACAISRPG